MVCISAYDEISIELFFVPAILYLLWIIVHVVFKMYLIDSNDTATPIGTLMSNTHLRKKMDSSDHKGNS